MPISLILTPFYHFHFRPTSGLLSSQDLTYCPNKMDKFSEKFQNAFDPPPPHFGEIILRIFWGHIDFARQILNITGHFAI